MMELPKNPPSDWTGVLQPFAFLSPFPGISPEQAEELARTVAKMPGKFLVHRIEGMMPELRALGKRLAKKHRIEFDTLSRRKGVGSLTLEWRGESLVKAKLQPNEPPNT